MKLACYIFAQIFRIIERMEYADRLLLQGNAMREIYAFDR